MSFTVSVPVKPYVKRFLENNYGYPVNFRNYPKENIMFNRMLHKPAKHLDSLYPVELVKYTSHVTIQISERSFNRNGWEISKTDNIAFGKYYERNVKMLMRTIVGTYLSFGMPIYIAITNFQDRFKMEEEYWSFESIKKDFFRYKSFNKIDFNHHAYEHLERLILLNMTNAGITSKSLVREIDKNLVQTQ